jgi:hypothetical protein
VLEDATCAPRTGTLTTSAGGNTRMAHPFTVVNSGQLVTAQVGVTKNAGSTGDYVVQIVALDGSGTPTNTVLAAATIPNASVPTGDQTLTAAFGPALNVVAGQQLAVLITRPGSAQFAVGIRSVMTDCPSMRFDSPTQNGGFTGDPATNLFFRIYVDVTLPVPEPEPEPQPKADGTLTIDANKGKVETGRKVTLSGQLDFAANEACEPGRQIQIQRRLKSEDDSKFAAFQTVQTDATGNYSTKVKVKKTYFYRAVVAENDACDGETSNSQMVRVQKRKAAQEA